MKNNKILILFLIISSLTLGSCSGDSPGYLFIILFVVLPLGWFGYSLQKKVDENTDSLYIIEGQLKRLIEKVDELEDKISAPAKTTRTRKTTTKK